MGSIERDFLLESAIISPTSFISSLLKPTKGVKECERVHEAKSLEESIESSSERTQSILRTKYSQVSLTKAEELQ